MSRIPEILHYCWFGRGKKSKTIEKCIESWKKNLHDYKFVEWNEDNFDIDSAPTYVKEAYEKRKYAFVSDYVRLHALEKFGGVYVDTDVEIRKDFSNLFKDFNMVLGFEHPNIVMTGFMASVAHMDIIQEFLLYYHKIQFIKDDGTFNEVTNPIKFTMILKERKLVESGEYQELINGIAIFPIEYFCGFDLNNDHPVITKNTYTIHHYTGTWNNNTKWEKILKRRLCKIIGYKNYDRFKSEVNEIIKK